jgi:hypothetical protein
MSSRYIFFGNQAGISGGKTLGKRKRKDKKGEKKRIKKSAYHKSGRAAFEMPVRHA